MTSTTKFYVTGGTMPSDAPSYIKRQADDELYHALQQGEYCYILDSSQMGKSSLVIRVMERLKQDSIKVVYFSLQPFGTTGVTLDNWYGSLLTEIDTQLELPTTALSFWDNQRQQNLTPTYCWDQVVRQIILGHGSEPIVFFLDEIGIVQKLPAFTDDFLLSLREFYNARTTHPDFRRLTFCLIGTATPASLIKDRHLPPFNVGQRIILEDFTETEVTSSLADGLQREAATATTLLQRVWYWTNGHPYLTQKLCEAVANDMAVTTAEGVDKVCQVLFLGSRRHKETNLGQVEDLVKNDPDVPGLLELYRQIRQQQVPDDDTQEKINALRLTGIIKVRDNALWVRNPIYLQVFDNAWVEATMPEAEKRRQQAAYRRGLIRASVVATGIIGAIGGGIYWYLDGYVWENATYCNTYAKRFGIMQCVGELTPEQVQGRAVSYKFMRKGRKNPVWKVQAVKPLKQPTSVQEKVATTQDTNPLGPSQGKEANTQSTEELTSYHEIDTYLKSPSRQEASTECQWEFVLDANGKIVYEKAYDQEGKLVQGLVYSPVSPGRPALAHYVDPEGFPKPPSNSSAEFVTIEYSSQGYEEKISFSDRQHHPQPGLDSVWKIQRQFNEQGLSIEEAYFDTDGRPVIGDHGYHKIMRTYNKLGNVTEEFYLDVKGQPTFDESLDVHKIKRDYDEQGNKTEVSYLDVKGQLEVKSDHESILKLTRIARSFKQKTGGSCRYPKEGTGLVSTVFAAGYTYTIFGADDSTMADLDLILYDENDNLIDRDTRKDAYSIVKVRPRWTGSYYILYDGHGYANVTICRADKHNNKIEQTHCDTNVQPLQTEVLVAFVFPDSQAQKLGIQAGDIFTHYDGKLISERSCFDALRRDKFATGPVPAKELQLLRDGQELTLQVLPGDLGVELENRFLKLK
jgi:hypothetical protein